ncbi:hypothetical protein P4H71_18140 [Paenibacillus kribbensis]|uniref:hypothetical protein n=1 Tax=Paenibacillus kribbensis TaxID=172713 RepID=UPI002DBAA6C6|nr:hypothetical protein [Paenibacillus kribbensis]MEC0236245.1 hypothetical protein [Paenibacillus kribbensis]
MAKMLNSLVTVSQQHIYVFRISPMENPLQVDFNALFRHYLLKEDNIDLATSYAYMLPFAVFFFKIENFNKGNQRASLKYT